MIRFYISIVLTLTFYCSFAQSEVFYGSLITDLDKMSLECIEVSDDFYYFGSRNNEGDRSTISIFQTTPNFEQVNTIEKLMIRGSESSFLSLMKIVEDRILLVSNARVNGKSHIYTHSVDLNLGNHFILDSIEIVDEVIQNQEFTASKYKNIDEKTLYTIGNLRTNNNTFPRSTNYLEISLNGKINKFKEIEGVSTITTAFDYNSVTNKYFVAEPWQSHIVDSSFTVVSTFDERIPIQIGDVQSFQALTSTCKYVSDNLVECVSSGSEGAEYSNFISVYETSNDELLFSNAIPLHPDTIDNLPTRIVVTSRDSQENYYFAYYELFSQFDEVIPNKVFISKFDKDLNNIYFLELISEDEHVYVNSAVDKDDSFIIVGALIPPDNPSAIRNSFIKISDNGELLTSTNSIYQPEEVAIYPNPSVNHIKMQLDDTYDIDYQIYSVDGRLEKRGVVSSVNGDFTIKTLGLPSGMHILNVFDGDKIRIARFIKQ